MIIPKKLRPGDLVRIVSPCYALDANMRGSVAAELERVGLRASFGAHAFDAELGYAASVKSRADDFNDAVRDPQVRLVLFSGGEVGNEILPFIDYAAARRDPKLYCSYSDGTNILNAITRLSGVATFYGQSPGTLSRGESYSETAFCRILLESGDGGYSPAEPWKTIRGGVADGELIGGYFENFSIELGSRFLTPERDKKYIFFFEDHIMFNNAAKIAKFAAHIEQTGFLESVAGILIGCYSDGSDESVERAYLDTLQRYVDRLGVPCVKSEDFGHGKYQAIIPLGVRARLDADAGTLTFPEGR